MFCVMCAIDIFFNKIMKSKFCVKKCQENVLQFMFLYIIRTPLLELKSVGKKCGLYTGKDSILSTTYYHVTMFIYIYPKIFVLCLIHENITIITIDGCTCSIASIYIIMISFMSSTLSYARPLNP